MLYQHCNRVELAQSLHSRSLGSWVPRVTCSSISISSTARNRLSASPHSFHRSILPACLFPTTVSSRRNNSGSCRFLSPLVHLRPHQKIAQVCWCATFLFLDQCSRDKYSLTSSFYLLATPPSLPSVTEIDHPISSRPITHPRIHTHTQTTGGPASRSQLPTH